MSTKAPTLTLMRTPQQFTIHSGLQGPSIVTRILSPRELGIFHCPSIAGANTSHLAGPGSTACPNMTMLSPGREEPEPIHLSPRSIVTKWLRCESAPRCRA